MKETLKFVNSISLGFDFGNIVLSTNSTTLWKPDNPVKTVFIYKNILY